MVVSMTLLLSGLMHVPPVKLLPGYVVAYVLIGACIFGPLRRVSLWQAGAFLLPGVLFAFLALLTWGSGLAAGCSGSRHGACC